MMNYPFKTEPCFKDYLWGGNRLKDKYGKLCGITPLAESWEFSTHPDGASKIGTGDFSGTDLRDYFAEHSEALGSYSGGENPLLIKYIDAQENLSVQVHPGDEYAFKNEGGQRGKTEFWYILEAAEGAEIVYGFSERVSRERFARLCESGEVLSVLNRIKVKKGDCFLISPGVIHAIGGGIILAEIQESSNLTYRVFDYNRVGKNGKKRELHLNKALDIIDFDFVPSADDFGISGELICKSDYFTVRRLSVPFEHTFEPCNTFFVLMCIEGGGRLTGKNGFEFSKGDTVFVPCGCEATVSGGCELLEIKCG